MEVPPKPPVVPAPPPPLPEPEPVPETLEDFLPLALYFDNDEPDKRTRRTYTRKDYISTYKPYISRWEEYRSEYAAPLEEQKRWEAEEAIDDFFSDSVQKGYNHLLLFSDILLSRLQAGEQVEIFIKGYTSPRAKSDYNDRLGQRRVSSLKKSLFGS